MSPPTQPLLARFWAKVDDSAGPDACWPWKAARFSDGYGAFWFRGTNERAHRMALELSGTPIPDGLRALHRCDNKPCCNPRHLYVGTDRDNARDRDARGLANSPRGERHGAARLTAPIVLAIRREIRAGRVQRAIARERGVSQMLVSRIGWGHLPEET